MNLKPTLPPRKWKSSWSVGLFLNLKFQVRAQPGGNFTGKYTSFFCCVHIIPLDTKEKQNSSCTSNLGVLLILARLCWRYSISGTTNMTLEFWRQLRWPEGTMCQMLHHLTNLPALTGKATWLVWNSKNKMPRSLGLLIGWKLNFKFILCCYALCFLPIPWPCMCPL